MYSFGTDYNPWDLESELFPDDELSETYSSDDRFGPERQADRELNREMDKYAAADNRGTDWESGLCHPIRLKEEGTHPDQWFAPWDSRSSAKAANTCFECPIRLQCLKYACDSKEEAGVWGGLPDRIRTGFTREHSAHDFEALAQVENPYLAENGSYAYYNLYDWIPGQQDAFDPPTIPEGKPVPRYPDFIAAPGGSLWRSSTKARVKAFTSKKGVVMVRLRNEENLTYGTQKRLSCVMAATYLGYPLDSGLPVEHINGNQEDNRVENLRWDPVPQEETAELIVKEA